MGETGLEIYDAQSLEQLNRPTLNQSKAFGIYPNTVASSEEHVITPSLQLAFPETKLGTGSLFDWGSITRKRFQEEFDFQVSGIFNPRRKENVSDKLCVAHSSPISL